MKIDFTPKFFYAPDPLSLAASATGIGIGALQGLIGLIGAGKANKQLKKLFKQRKAFQTPQEIIDVLNLSQFNAQTGFGSETLDYLTNQSGRGLAAGLGAATRLGADPNDIAGSIDQHFQNIFRTGSEGELFKMKKFDNVFNALKLNADSKAAEWQSKENLLKDEMQMQGQKAAAGQQNLQSGLNMAVNSFSSLATQNLWKNQLDQIKGIIGQQSTNTGGGNVSGVGAGSSSLVYDPRTGSVRNTNQGSSQSVSGWVYNPRTGQMEYR